MTTLRREIQQRILEIPRKTGDIAPSASRCKLCGEPIEWATTTRDKAMPLDVEPRVDGNVVIRDNVAHVLPKGEAIHEGEVRRMPHWSTCPNAKDFRAKTKR